MNTVMPTMSLYNILLGVQYASIILMLFMCAYIIKKWSKPLHGWLFFYCVSTLINTAGYFAVMHAQSLREAILAWQVSYLGRVWIPLSLLVFVMLLCKGRIYKCIVSVTSILHAVIYILVITASYNTLYYTSIEFVNRGIFPHLILKYGILHHIYTFLLIFYIAYGLTLLFASLIKEKNPRKIKQLLLILLVVFFDGLFYVFNLCKVIPGYDITCIGYALASIVLCIAIFFYDILDTKGLAQDFVIENVSEGIIATREDGTVSFSNQKARSLFSGLTDAPEKTLENIKKLFSNVESVTIQDRIYTIKEDSLTANGHKAGEVYVISDETEHFRYMQELEEQRNIADRANQAKSLFLANMSHEIRTPINAVLGLDEMILRESSEENVKAYAHDIMSSGKSLLAIINDILDLSKIEAGKMEIINSVYDLRGMLNDLCTMTELRAKGKSLQFKVRVDEDTPYRLFGDETRIRQCVLNILTNAVKYTHKGSVNMEVGFKKVADNKISLSFCVTDTGIGIKKEDIEKLNKPFERIEESRNRSIEGTGLGMSITSALLSKMGSVLKVESEYGRGSKFYFDIEQEVRDWDKFGTMENALKGLRTEAVSYHESFQAPNAHILVVDDTPMNLTVIKGLLKQTRINIDTANDADSALAVAKINPYDIIFIDHLMPNKDGIQMLAELRADSSSVNQKAVCIALTANAITGAREMFLSSGFEDYISKPVNSAKLEAMMSRYLPAEKMIHEGDEGFVVQKSKEGGASGGRGVSDALFKKMFGVDICEAVKNCGSMDTFMDAVNIFWDSIEEKSEKTEQYANDGDWTNYTVLVHALKSSARLIGAMELSALAKELEASGDEAKRGEEHGVADIKERTPTLLSDWRAYKDRLAYLCGKAISTQKAATPSEPNISQKQIDDAMSALKECVQAFDFNMADNIIAELDNYSLPEDFIPKYKKIRSTVRAVDRAALLELLSE